MYLIKNFFNLMKLKYTQQYLTNILKNVKTITIVGASSKEKEIALK